MLFYIKLSILEARYHNPTEMPIKVGLYHHLHFMDKGTGHVTISTSHRKKSSAWIQTFYLPLSHTYSHNMCHTGPE